MSRADREFPAHPFVRSAYWFDEIDSTSDEARRLLGRSPLTFPGLVWADRQTKGRGQRSNSWWSDAGSLTATLILDPPDHGLAPEKWPTVALATGVAIVGGISDLYPGCRPGLRWPNDVEVDGRKLGGILAERVGTDSGPKLLVGIGLNVRTQLADAPGEVRAMAATLADFSETNPTPEPRLALLGAILDRLPGVLGQLARDDPELPRRWQALDTLAGSTIRVEVGDEPIEAIAAGIDESGALRLDQDGRIRAIRSGRILR